MGVITRVDEIMGSTENEFKAAQNHLRNIRESLSEVLDDNEVWGRDEYDLKELERGLQKIQDMERKLKKLKRRLGV